MSPPAGARQPGEIAGQPDGDSAGTVAGAGFELAPADPRQVRSQVRRRRAGPVRRICPRDDLLYRPSPGCQEDSRRRRRRVVTRGPAGLAEQSKKHNRGANRVGRGPHDDLA